MLAWIWTDLLSEQRRATQPVLVETVMSRVGGNDSLHDAREDSRLVRNSFHGKEVSTSLHEGACTGACAFFAGSVVCIQTGFLSTMHAQVFMLNGCCVHQRTHLRTRSQQDVHMRSCMCSLFI